MTKKRGAVLLLVALGNLAVSAWACGDFDWNSKTVNWPPIGWSLLITALGFGIIFLFNRAQRPFARKKLNKNIIAFTQKANPNYDLKIMAGDLTFFGECKEMDSNLQLKQLRELKFKRIQIISQRPTTEPEKARVGKLMHVLHESKLDIKFYNDSFPDLRLRFRCITLGEGSTATINIFKFTAEKEYITEKLYPSSSDRQKTKRNQTFLNLWEVYWNALQPDAKMLEECTEVYNRFR